MKRFTLFSLILAMMILPLSYAQHNQNANRSSRTIVDIAANAGSFNTLVTAVKAAGLESTLRSSGPFTVFAPTDEAFAKLPSATLQSLLKPENKDKLVAILTYHVVSGKIRSTDLLNVAQAKTVNSANLPIGLRVQNSNVIKADIDASNGIIHVIDAVLIPPDMMNTSQNVRTNTNQNSRNNWDAYRASELEKAQDKWSNYRTSEYDNWQREQAATGFQRAKTRIERAINNGSQKYNQGDVSGCAAIYMETAETLMRAEPLNEGLRNTLATALTNAKQTHNATDRAWIMRRALDETYQGLAR